MKPFNTSQAVVAFVLLGMLTGCNRRPSSADDGPGLSASSSAARSCDVVLALEGDRELDVRFVGNVLGSSFQRGARVGISVTAEGDRALGRFTKGLGEGVSIEETRCFDREGDVLGGSGVALR